MLGIILFNYILGDTLAKMIVLTTHFTKKCIESNFHQFHKLKFVMLVHLIHGNTKQLLSYYSKKALRSRSYDIVVCIILY